jgi:hypothetical protein
MEPSRIREPEKPSIMEFGRRKINTTEIKTEVIKSPPVESSCIYPTPISIVVYLSILLVWHVEYAALFQYRT